MPLGTGVPASMGNAGHLDPHLQHVGLPQQTSSLNLLLDAQQNPQEFDLLNYILASEGELEHLVHSLMLLPKEQEQDLLPPAFLW